MSRKKNNRGRGGNGNQGSSHRSSSAPSPRGELSPKAHYTEEDRRSPTSSGSSWPSWIMVIVLLLAVGGLGSWFASLTPAERNDVLGRTVSKQNYAKVVEVSWKITTTLREESAAKGSAWKDDLPVTAHNKKCAPKHRRFVSCEHNWCRQIVKDEKSCNCKMPEDISQCPVVDGAPQCEPVCEKCETTTVTMGPCHPQGDDVTDEWCEYTYYVRDEIGKSVTSGTGDDKPVAPELEATKDGQTISTEEMYMVKFEPIGKKGSEEFFIYRPKDEKSLARFKVGQVWEVGYYIGEITPQKLTATFETAPAPPTAEVKSNTP